MKRTAKILYVAFTLFAFRSYSQQLAQATDVQMVLESGTKIVMTGGITFKGTSNWVNKGETYLYKNTSSSPEGWLDSTASGVLGNSSTGNVFFNGSYLQSFYGKTKFYDLTIRNTIGDTLLSSCEVRNLLHLDTGLVYTRSGYGNDSLLVSNVANAAIVSTSGFAKSWVHGRLSRTISTTAGVDYLFPTGKIKSLDSLYAPIRIDKANTVSNTYTAEYFPATPYDNGNINNPPIDHISKQEYWEITATTASGPNADCKISLSWRTYSKVSTISSERDKLLVVQYVSDPTYKWYRLGSSTTHTVTSLPDETFGYVKHPDYLGALSYAERRFTLGTLSAFNALPLKLLYFNAMADGDKVRLNWNVANEQDILFYEVERSLNGTSFSHLSTVNSLQLTQSVYTDYDYTPVIGRNYYRLKIFDIAGKFTYSPVRTVAFEKGMQPVSIFPNPAKDILNILLPSAYAGQVALQLLGADGKFISSLKPTAVNIRLNVGSLAAGTYSIRLVHNDGGSETYRFIKQQE